MKANKRSEVKDERRKDKEEFTNTSVADMLSKMMKQQSAQEIDFDVFDRNPLDLYYFMAVFREAAEKKIEDPRGRLICLIKYTTGEGKDSRTAFNFQLMMFMKQQKINFTIFMVTHIE